MPDIHSFEPIWPNWVIDEVIGRGSFGTVWKAHREDVFAQFTQYAAVKHISIPSETVKAEMEELSGVSKDTVQKLYRRELDQLVKEIMAMLEIRGCSHIVAYEEHKIIEKNEVLGYDLFLRMELLTSLPDHVKKTGGIDRDEVFRLGIHMLRALETLQSRKLIHRDIKPANIFIDTYGDYKLGDFGTARALQATGYASTRAGTPNYMAPEVYNGSMNYDQTVDIYSLGIVLYRYMNRGFLPYIDEENMNPELAIIKRAQGEVLPPPSQADADFAGVILKACAYRPQDRYQSAQEMRKALEELQRAQGISGKANCEIRVTCVLEESKHEILSKIELCNAGEVAILHAPQLPGYEVVGEGSIHIDVDAAGKSLRDHVTFTYRMEQTVMNNSTVPIVCQTETGKQVSYGEIKIKPGEETWIDVPQVPGYEPVGAKRLRVAQGMDGRIIPEIVVFQMRKQTNSVEVPVFNVTTHGIELSHTAQKCLLHQKNAVHAVPQPGYRLISKSPVSVLVNEDGVANPPKVLFVWKEAGTKIRKSLMIGVVLLAVALAALLFILKPWLPTKNLEDHEKVPTPYTTIVPTKAVAVTPNTTDAPTSPPSATPAPLLNDEQIPHKASANQEAVVISKKGFAGPVAVTVSFGQDGSTIQSLSIGDKLFAESAGYGASALEPAFSEQFLGKKAPLGREDIEAISGATITTDAVLDAINEAYEQQSSSSTRKGESKDVPAAKADAITVSKEGFSGPVAVTVSFGQDGSTIQSLSIGDKLFDETPGLGAYVLEPAFSEQFIGKKAPLGREDIDVNSGTTITTDAVLDAINEAFKQQIPSSTRKAASTNVPVAMEDAVTASVEGFAGPVAVTVSFDQDGSTIQSLSIGDKFFDETPGIGASALEPAFSEQFIGKKPPLGREDIDVISGATVTTDAVLDAINEAYGIRNSTALEKSTVITPSPKPTSTPNPTPYVATNEAAASQEKAANSAVLSPSPSEPLLHPVSAEEQVEDAIRKAINKPEGSLNDVFLLQLKSLQVNGQDQQSVGNLSLLTHCTNLTSLELTNLSLIDPSFLLALENLQSLNLSNNVISDVKPISLLSNLETLDVSNNRISRIDNLSKLAVLKTLHLNDNQISDIRMISNMSNLQVLSLQNNEISDISPLFEMVGLKELNLLGNPINQTDLEILRSALPLCSINGEKSNYQAAGDAALLQSVQMVLGGSAKNLNMESFKHLTWFDLKDAGTPEANNYSFQLLQAAVNMEVLQIMRLGINDLAPLAKMEKLKEIYAYENDISDLSPMENLTNLQFANLYGNQISDLRPLAGLHRLQILLLHMNQISDITPLLGLANLRELDVTGNPVSSEDIERLRKALPQCRINGQLPSLP